VFSPDRTATDNKAGLEAATGQPRSYGTATCDGLLALAALNAHPARPNTTAATRPAAAASSEPAWTAALDWFARLDTWDVAPGGTPALWFYWCARLMEVAEHFPDARRQAARTAVAAAIIDRQRADGSWANPEPAMREDDPLIATPLAIAALGGLN
jgi:hypothetical protein